MNVRRLVVRRGPNSVLCPLMSLLLFTNTCLLRIFPFVTSTSNDLHHLENDDRKDALPEKGNEVCQSLPERYENFMDRQVTSEWLRPCEDEDDIGVDGGSIGVNSLNMTVYTSLPAYAPDLGKAESQGCCCCFLQSPVQFLMDRYACFLLC